MISVLLWKEYREHRMVWAVLALISAATVVYLSIPSWDASFLREQPEARAVPLVTAAFLVGIYALICGAMLFAGERENGTLPFLDALPGWRRRLWLGKFFSGVVLVLGQIVFLTGLSAAILLFATWKEVALALGGMMLAGLFGLSWGMLFSSFGRSVINVILLSLGGYMALGFGAGIATALFLAVASAIYGTAPQGGAGPFIIGSYVIIVPAALACSALVFTRLDRRRLWAVPDSPRTERRTPRPSWSMLFWLTWRQARGFAAGLAAFALLLGVLVPRQAVILWPIATLVVGVLCGAAVFADEQQGPFRFLGDQRFTLGRLWTVKVGVRFGIAVVTALLVLAPSFIAALYGIPTSRWNNPVGEYHFFAHVFHSDILVDLCPPGLFLTLWLVYGFCGGCLFGLLFRNGLAAGVFALFSCSLTAALWIPSLLGGGLHAWQVFGPPVLILFASRLLMRPWAAGRIASWTTTVRLIPFVALSGLWIAGGLWYRVLEIPNVPPRFDLDAFRAGLPTPEQDEGGRLFRSACLRFDDLRHTLQSDPALLPDMADRAGPAAIPGLPPGMMGQTPAGAIDWPPSLRPVERANTALEHGWPTGDHVLALWLDKLYAGEWPAMLKQAADLPTSPFDDVRNTTFQSSLPATQPTHELAVILAVRGLQRQAAGNDEAFVENLRIGLCLSRSLRDRCPTIDFLAGRTVEYTLLTGLDRWLEKLRGRPDLIRQALALLSHYLEETAGDYKDQELVEDLNTKNNVEDPFPALLVYLSNENDVRDRSDSRVREEAKWVAIAWLVPWEHARQARILRVMFDGDKPERDWLHTRLGSIGPLPYFGFYGENKFLIPRPDLQCVDRAMQLKLALRWYQADNGRAAENLDKLVPKYLPSIPLDPYDGAPFRYRLSQGEEIEWPADSGATSAAGMPVGEAAPQVPHTREIPAGQGVLWSVGEDKVDNGGHRQSGSLTGQAAAGEDMIFLVPLPPQAK